MNVRRKRRPTPPGEFVDPLSKYDPPEYADKLERSLSEDAVTAIKHTPMATLPPDVSVEEAMREMVRLDVAYMLIAEGQNLLGVFSERDVLNKIAGQFEKVKKLPVRAFMSPDPVVVYETESPAKALNVMAVGGFRHVPIVNIDDKLVGVLGPRRVTSYLQQYFTQ
jgi:CBS domain-containing protein